ncbi:MAG: lipoyl(octanoyl) transferase LipB [Candidatus Eisenbacteria bacterium]|nr:lipoyl(octanoyl) transferase LipB [Candidatus Eisenbacteria bacterium]
MPLARRSTSDRETGAGAASAVAPVSTARARPPLRILRLAGFHPYEEAWALQREIHAERVRGSAPDTLILLEHRPVVTIGRNGRAANLVVPQDLLRARGIDLVWSDRGGDITYHGPGQLIGYPIVDLKTLHQDVHRFLREIEEGIIRVLARFGIVGTRCAGRTGVWVGEAKIASIGLKASHWVTMHGFALNVSTDLRPFDLIVPCGINGCRMITMESELGREIAVEDVAAATVEELALIWKRTPTMEGMRS